MPSYADWGKVPLGEQNALTELANAWEKNTGYNFVVPDWAMLNMARYGFSTMQEFGSFVAGQVAPFVTGNGNLAAQMPWAQYGMTKDTYAGLATTYGTEFKKLTGQDIPSDALQSAFAKVKDPTGAGFLSGSQYAQKLQSDTNMQNTYGWLKYGMDYSQFQQHKLGMTAAFGGTPTDAQATQALSYWHQNASATAEVRAQTQTPGQQQKAPSPGEAQSVIR